MRAINRLDNALFVIARLQAVERAFTENGCTFRGLKGAWHRAVKVSK